MAIVNIGRNRVTDEEILSVLDTLCIKFERNIIVVRGEVDYPRNHFPSEDDWYHGVAKAVDFHIEGFQDITTYQKIKNNYNSIFSSKFGYEVFWYGSFSEAKHPCICITRFNKTMLGRVKFYKYGDRPENANKSWLDGELYTLWAEKVILARCGIQFGELFGN